MVLMVLLMVAYAQEPIENQGDSEIPAAITEARSEMGSLSIGQRMKLVTDPLLGADYIIDAIGEEKLPDLDPFVRYDAFDCLTFVEEAMALSLGENPAEITKIRNELRYQNKTISYRNRNHFMVSQWIPNNIAKGYFVDITHTLGETHLVSKIITERTWSRWRGRHKYSFDISNYPVGTYSFGILSLDAAIANLKSIPDGALIIIVRQNKSYNPLVITHLGFVVRHSSNDVRIRHATKMATGIVKDHYLLWYLEHIRKFTKWPVEGIIVLMPQEL
jgi:hypothetical protein